MEKTKVIFLKLFISIISIGFFWGLESGFTLRNGDELLKSLIFASAFFIVLTNKFKNYLLRISVTLLVIMVILYLFWQIPLSSFFGSIGFGILSIFVLSYIPDLVRKGYIEKL